MVQQKKNTYVVIIHSFKLLGYIFLITSIIPLPIRIPTEVAEMKVVSTFYYHLRKNSFSNKEHLVSVRSKQKNAEKH